ncbi:MAG: hypothetical protein A2Y21_03420 [Clostridiales bacterium GWC2_40_7]|nr:MAG: hypothetical protein A2Y21_03420 [Clostridiales bacterium GWC2_40_7]
MVKVLIVDDEKYVCERLKNDFDWESLGFDYVYTAQNGEEAIDIIKLHNPGLILSDVRMPIMDGIQLARYVGMFYPATKMIFISAYDEFQYARQAIDYGVKSYLLKPVEKQVLKESILKVMGNAHVEPGHDDSGKASEDVNLIMIRKVQRYIKENYYRKISLEDVAKYVYISPQYLSRKFKEVTGQQFVDYALNVKITRAKSLLKNSGIKVKDIAVQLGFSDYTYFCKVFKKYENITPLQYRAKFVLTGIKDWRQNGVE